MKLVTEKAHLVDHQAEHAQVIERRVTVPLLGFGRFELDEGKLTITSTNLDQWLVSTTMVASEGNGHFLAPMHTLAAFAAKVAEGAQISIEHEGGQAPLRIKAGRASVTLPTLDEDYPECFEMDGERTSRARLPAKLVDFLVETPRQAISTEKTRFYLNGIFLDPAPAENALFAVATDGHRLIRCRTDLPDELAAAPGVILPRQAVPVVLRLLKESTDVDLAWSEQRLELRAGDFRFVTKLIDGQFPDYRRVIPNQFTATIEAKSDDIRASLDRLASVSDRTRATKLERISGGLMLTGGIPDRGKGEETLVADIGENDSFDYIGFNGRYLHDALGLGDQVILQIGSVDAPCRLTFATPEGVDRPFDPVEVVLMPLRV